jgi:exodeoxyribonuclease VII small subunit
MTEQTPDRQAPGDSESGEPTPGEPAPGDPTPGASDNEPSYEAARDELIQIVQRLESGGAPLDEALTLWERGEELAAVCQRWLDGARARIDAARPEG